MDDLSYRSSPQTYARTGGFAYLIIIAAGAFGQMYARNSIVVPGDPVVTGNNIISHAMLWRMGIAADLLMHICDIVVMICLYVLLKPVNRHLALMAVLFNLVQTAVLVANKLNLVLSLILLEGRTTDGPFNWRELEELSYQAIRAHNYGFGIGLIFFGCACLVTGYLIFRSGFLPKLIGILIVVAGLCYLANSFAMILAPKLSSMALLFPAFIGELILCLWLIVKGVDVKLWRALKLKRSGFAS